jgi:DUF1680 family protein
MTMPEGITRREFVLGASAVALNVQVPSASGSENADPFSEFNYDQVRLTGGPLKQHYDRIHASYLSLDNDRLLKVYRQRAGMAAPGADMGGWYDADGFVPGHTLGQYISGLARIGSSTGDTNCHSKVSELVEGFAATLGKSNQVFAGPNAEKVWPCYVLDKHIAGLIDAATLTGNVTARELLPRVFHGALPYIPEQGHDRIGKKDPPYDEPYVMPENLFAAYALTQDHAFHDRATAFMLDREFFDPLARGEDVLPGRHAYSHAIALSSAGKARLVLNDEKYLRAMQRAWDLLTQTQQYATGGWGPNETFIEPHKGQLYSSLQSTVDHFETPCGSYAASKLGRYLLCATGDARYGDGIERVIYNALLAVKDPDADGDYPYYSTYSPSARKVYYLKKWPCCSGTLVQGVADYVKSIYLRSTDGIAVNLYAPSEVRWQAGSVQARPAMIQITQSTAYPLGESIELRVEPSTPTAFTIRLRIPSWLARPASIQVNGEAVHPQVQKGFAALTRTWKSGDAIMLTLPQTPRTEAIDDLHPETVAALRGPLVYVETNPAPGPARLATLENWQALSGSPGTYHTGNASSDANRDRVFAPIYCVRDESYTTYFQKG